MKPAVDIIENQITTGVYPDWSFPKAGIIKGFWESVDQQLISFQPQQDDPIEKIRAINRDILHRLKQIAVTPAIVQGFAKPVDSTFQSVYHYRNVIRTLADCYMALNEDLVDPMGLAKSLTQQLCLSALTIKLSTQYADQDYLLTQAFGQIEEQVEFMLFNILYQAGKA